MVLEGVLLWVWSCDRGVTWVYVGCGRGIGM